MTRPSLSHPCPKCKAPAGQFCKTKNGHRTTEHIARLDAAAPQRRAA